MYHLIGASSPLSLLWVFAVTDIISKCPPTVVRRPVVICVCACLLACLPASLDQMDNGYLFGPFARLPPSTTHSFLSFSSLLLPSFLVSYPLFIQAVLPARPAADISTFLAHLLCPSVTHPHLLSITRERTIISWPAITLGLHAHHHPGSTIS